MTYKVSKRKTLVKNLLLLEGHTRAGKFLLGKILDGFEGIEHFQYMGLIEQLPFLERLGCISREAAVSLLQIAVDENAYHLRIGRNLNLRNDDSTSMLKSFFLDRYLPRAFESDTSKIPVEFKKTKRYSAFVGHETLPNIKIFFDAFPAMKTISIQRHPIDIIHSWWLRGWCQRETCDPLYFQSCINEKGVDIPWFAYSWSRQYQKMNPLERTIMSVCRLEEMSRKSFRALTPLQKKQVLFISHEDLIENSWEVIREIESFLKIKSSGFMPAILKRERCLRELSREAREKKILQIKNNTSPKIFKIMEALSDKYEQCQKEGSLKKLYQ